MALRDLAIAVEPVIPTKSAELLDQLGVAEDSRSYAELDDRAWYDRLIASGFTVSKPTPIFPRLELPEDQAA